MPNDTTLAIDVRLQIERSENTTAHTKGPRNRTAHDAMPTCILASRHFPCTAHHADGWEPDTHLTPRRSRGLVRKTQTRKVREQLQSSPHSHFQSPERSLLCVAPGRWSSGSSSKVTVSVVDHDRAGRHLRLLVSEGCLCRPACFGRARIPPGSRLRALCLPSAP